nr:reverse transcriptase domain-containing protein [Tanacetum cinerariifolium]
MTTRSAGQATATLRGGWTGGQTGSGGGRTRGQSGAQGNGMIDGQGDQVGGQGIELNDGVDEVPDFSTIIVQQLRNLLSTILAQVGDQGSNLGNGRNQNDDVVNENIQGDVRNIIENNHHRGCTYKEFLACNPKDYVGKGGAIVYTHWIKKMESVQDISGCRDNQKVKILLGYLFHELARLLPHLVTPKNKRIDRYVYGLSLLIRRMVAAIELTTIQKAMQIAGTLTDESIRNGSIKKNHEKIGSKGEPSKDRNERDDNKRTRTGNAFATTINPVRRENTGIEPSDLGFSYEIETVSEQLAEINKVVNGCKLEIEVRIPLLDGKVLSVLGERPKKKARNLMSTKAKEQKQEEMVVVRDFLK